MKNASSSGSSVLRDQVLHADYAGFFKILRSLPPEADDTAADYIELRAREKEGDQWTLDDFLDQIPHLRSRPVVLDAAIDAVIRAKVNAGSNPDKIVKELKARYPHLQESIDAAAMLAMLLGTSYSKQPTSRELPEAVGPPTEAGVPRYALRDRLGTGGNGTVVLAVDRLMSVEGVPALVAVKFLNTDSASALQQRLAAAEALTASKISHPNVAKTLDRGVTDDGWSFVVTEHIAGGTLEGLVTRDTAPLPLVKVLSLVCDICRGVQAIHSVGMLHCDLKPSNVLLTPDGAPKVGDFGLVRWSMLPSALQRRVAGGTSGFGAPEQFTSPDVLDNSCDTYALGGILLWCLTREVPNGRTPEIAEALLKERGASGPASPHAIDSIADPDVRAICRKALDRDRAHRYHAAEALATDLERVLRHEPLPWNPVPIQRQLRRWCRRERKALTVAIASIGVVATLVYSLSRAQDSAARAAERASIAAAQENIERQRSESLRAAVRTANDVFSDMKKRNVAIEWLGLVTMLESLTGPHFDLTTQAGRELWNDRVQVALGLAEDAPEGSILAAQWELAAGYWMVHANDHAEAVKLFDRNIARWAAMGTAGAHYEHLARQIRAAAVMLDPDRSREKNAARTEAMEVLRNRKEDFDAWQGKGVNQLLDRAISQGV
jgi:serine/threonine protein kinase